MASTRQNIKPVEEELPALTPSLLKELVTYFKVVKYFVDNVRDTDIEFIKSLEYRIKCGRASAMPHVTNDEKKWYKSETDHEFSEESPAVRQKAIDESRLSLFKLVEALLKEARPLREARDITDETRDNIEELVTMYWQLYPLPNKRNDHVDGS